MLDSIVQNIQTVNYKFPKVIQSNLLMKHSSWIRDPEKQWNPFKLKINTSGTLESTLQNTPIRENLA